MVPLRFWRVVLQLGTVLACAIEGCNADTDSVTLISGDVNIAAMFPINDVTPGSPAACGPYREDSIQSLQAVKWFLGKLNEMNYVPGVKIGLGAYRTCMQQNRAVDGAMSFMHKYSVGDETVINTPLFGILGPDSTHEAKAVSRFVSSLPAEKQVLQMSGSATGEDLSNRTLYPNFYRVVPPDSTQVQVMLELLQQLGWNYVAIVYDEDDYGRSVATELRRLAEDKQICVTVFESMPTVRSSLQYTEKIGSIADMVKAKSVRGAVVIAGHDTTQKLLSRFSQEASFVQFILHLEAEGLRRSALVTSGGSVELVARGALLVAPQHVELPEFRSHWNDLWTSQNVFLAQAAQNPWLAGYFTQETGCSNASLCWDEAQVSSKRQAQHVPSSGSSGEGLGLFTWYHVKAAAVLAKLLKKMQAENCQSQSGVCADLRNAIKNRRELQRTLQDEAISLDDLGRSVSGSFAGVSVRFDNKGDIEFAEGEPNYSVYNFRKEASGEEFVFKQVGSFVNHALTMQTADTQFYDSGSPTLTWEQLPPSLCPANRDCAECRRDLTGHVLFVEGDFYVVVMVPVYSKNPTNSMQCGEINGFSGADLAQAAIFAVDRVNTKSGMYKWVLPDRKVGLLVINTCGTPLLVRQRLLELHSGRLKLPDGRNSSFLLPQIMGYVGAYYSSSSIAASDTLTQIGRTFVEVSGTSTSPALSDRSVHPFFMRLVPPDDTQAQVLLDVVVSLGANYIQVIYDETTAYATGLFNQLVEQARGDKYDVCIAQAIATRPRAASSEYKWIVDKLRDKSHAKLVIVLQHELEAQKTMDAILPALGNDGLMFLASESWGRRQQLIDGADRDNLEGSLVVSQELAVDKLFQNQFERTDPLHEGNVWLRDFWEERENCYFEKSFSKKGKAGPCREDIAHDYLQDTWAPFYINAVYAIILGFNSSMSQYCSLTAASICSSLTSERLVEGVKRVKLDVHSTGRMESVFDDNGDGLGGFRVLQIVRDLSGAGHMVYRDVGTWTQEGLVLKTEDLVYPRGSEFKSICPNDLECTKCFTITSANTSSSTSGDDTVPLPVTVGVGVSLFVVAVVLLVIVIVLCRRRSANDKWLTQLEAQQRRALQEPPGRTPSQNHYSDDMTGKSLPRGTSDRSLPLDMSDRSVLQSRDMSDQSLPRIAVDPGSASSQAVFFRSVPDAEQSRASQENPYALPYDLPNCERKSNHTYATTINFVGERR